MRHKLLCYRKTTLNFNPRIPQGMRRFEVCSRQQRGYDFNPRIPQGMRQGRDEEARGTFKISIHAFRRECDSRRTSSTRFTANFNPRIPQGMRLGRLHLLLAQKRFQSTHSAGNATFTVSSFAFLSSISIHAFRRECDSIWCSSCFSRSRFQSTHSAGNATTIPLIKRGSKMISIHAFRRECDKTSR